MLKKTMRGVLWTVYNLNDFALPLSLINQPYIWCSLGRRFQVVFKLKIFSHSHTSQFISLSFLAFGRKNLILSSRREAVLFFTDFSWGLISKIWLFNWQISFFSSFKPNLHMASWKFFRHNVLHYSIGLIKAIDK
jgi:hypothetical protein